MNPTNTSAELPQELAPLYFPKVDPRPGLVEAFSQRIDEVFTEKAPYNLIFLLFQREMMLRREPDPTLVSWANKLQVDGDFHGNDEQYVRYLIRKWLACLPPLFAQLSCLKGVLFSEDVSEHQNPLHYMYLTPQMFQDPEHVFEHLTQAFVQSIPFFSVNGGELRQSTLLIEGTVFSLDEWWQVFADRFQQRQAAPRAIGDAARQSIAERLATYLSQPATIHEKSADPEYAMVDILAHASIHSYVG